MKIDLLCLGCYNLECDFIEEYLQYYFDTIHIDTIHLIDDTCGNEHILTELPYVRYMVDCGRIKYYNIPHNHKAGVSLTYIYLLFYEAHKDEFDWLCVFDCDEYIYIKDNTILNMLLGVNDSTDIVAIPWITYGDNGYIERPESKSIDLYIDKDNIIPYDFCKLIVRGGLSDMHFESQHYAKCSHDITYIDNTKVVDVDKDDYWHKWCDLATCKEQFHLKHIYIRSIRLHIERRWFSNASSPFIEIPWVIKHRHKETIFLWGVEWTEQKEIVFKGYETNDM